MAYRQSLLAPDNSGYACHARQPETINFNELDSSKEIPEDLIAQHIYKQHCTSHSSREMCTNSAACP